MVHIYMIHIYIYGLLRVRFTIGLDSGSFHCPELDTEIKDFHPLSKHVYSYTKFPKHVLVSYKPNSNQELTMTGPVTCPNSCLTRHISKC